MPAGLVGQGDDAAAASLVVDPEVPGLDDVVLGTLDVQRAAAAVLHWSVSPDADANQAGGHRRAERLGVEALERRDVARLQRAFMDARGHGGALPRGRSR